MKNENDVQILMDLPRNISNFNPNIPPHSGTQVFMCVEAINHLQGVQNYPPTKTDILCFLIFLIFMYFSSRHLTPPLLHLSYFVSKLK